MELTKEMLETAAARCEEWPPENAGNWYIIIDEDLKGKSLYPENAIEMERQGKVFG